MSTPNTRMEWGPEGCLFIDTPGFRDFALTDLTQSEVNKVFPDMAELAGKCHFRNCSHTHEEGCGLRQALREHLVDQERFMTYQRMAGNLKGRTPSRDCGQSSHQESFQCKGCGALVGSDGSGTQHRNHCPACLYSLHVDNRPGDRGSVCHGIMEPISVWVRHGGEWAIIHRCRECGALHSNRIAADDNPMLLMSLAVRPLSQPPFPLHSLSPK